MNKIDLKDLFSEENKEMTSLEEIIEINKILSGIGNRKRGILDNAVSNSELSNEKLMKVPSNFAAQMSKKFVRPSDGSTSRTSVVNIVHTIVFEK